MTRPTLAYVAVMLFLCVGAFAAHQLIVGSASSFKPTPKEQAVLVALNAQRAKYHLPKLVYSETLAKFARAHTTDMIKRNYFSHDAPGGPPYAGRARVLLSAGRHIIEENIGYGTGSYGTAKALVASWMASPPHRANILNPKVHKTGQGIASGRYQGNPVAVVATSEFSN